MENQIIPYKSNAIKRGSVFGGVAGVVSLLAIPVMIFFAACCPLGTLLWVLPAVLTGCIAAFFVAFKIDLKGVPESDHFKVGVLSGCAAGFVSSLVSLSILIVISVFFAGVIGALALNGDLNNSQGQEVEGLEIFIGIVFYVMMILISFLPGIIFGCAAGALGIAVRSQPRS